MIKKNLTLVFVALMIITNMVSAQNIIDLSKGVEVEQLNGRPVEFSELIKEGEDIKIISFWATWCKPCIQELDYLNDIYDELNLEKNVTLYAISIDDARSVKRVRPFVNGKSWEFEVLIDENSVLKRKLNVLNVPHTFIVGKDNKIIYQHTSYVPGDEEAYLEIIDGLN